MCLNCGTNLLTGQKIASEAPAPSRRWLPESVPPWTVAAAGLAVAAVILVGVLLWALRGDPVDEALQRARAGDEAGATRILTEYVAKRPDNTRAWVELGRLQFRSNPSGAAASFEEAMSASPYAARMVVLGLAGSPDPQARQRQIEALRHLLRQQPDNRDARMLLALTFGLNGEPARQAEVLREMVTQGDTDWQTRLHLAISYAQQGQLDQARDEIEQALAAQPDNPEVRAARGFIASMAGANDVAAEQLRSAVNAAAAQQEVLLQLGVQLIRDGDYSAAEPYLSQAVERYSANEAARFYYALTLQALDRDEQAIQMYEALVQQRAGFAAEAAVQAADIYLKTGRVERAREMIDTATSLGANNAPLFTTLGRIEVMAGDDAAARDAFRKAIQIDPAYPAVRLENGLLYVKQENFAEAVPELERYLVLAGEGSQGARTDEVTALIGQLKQNVGGPSPAPTATDTATRSEAL